MSPCKEGETRDRTTKHCRKKLKPGKKTVACPPNQIKDRKTRKCRDKLKPGKKRVACPPDQIKDRKTKECRDKLKRGRKPIVHARAEVVNPTQELFEQCKRVGANGTIDIKKMLTIGANINATDESGKTPLMILAQQGNVGMIDLFLLNHADITVLTKQHESVLHFANELALKKLLEYPNAPLNQLSKEGHSALYAAIERNSVKSVQLLLQHNATILPFDEEKENEIQFAISNATLLDNTTVVRTMLPYLNKEQLYDAYLEATYWADPENLYIESDRVKFKHIADIIHKTYTVRFPEKKARKTVPVDIINKTYTLGFPTKSRESVLA